MQTTFESEYVAWRERNYLKIGDKWVNKKYSWLKYSNDALLSYYSTTVSKARAYLVDFAAHSIVVSIQQTVDLLVLSKFVSALHGEQVLSVSPISTDELPMYRAAGVEYYHYRSLF